jgi:hypothetical protein
MLDLRDKSNAELSAQNKPLAFEHIWGMTERCWRVLHSNRMNSENFAPFAFSAETCMDTLCTREQ